MLDKLVDYGKRNETAVPKLYAEGALRYVIALNPDGECRSRQLIDLSDPSTPRNRRGTQRLLPQVQRTSGIRPLLLASPSDYTLGLPKSEMQLDRAQRAHAAYVNMVERCAAETEEQDVVAVLNFLKNEPLQNLELEDDFDNSGIITFQVDGRYVIDNPAVQRFWAAVNEPDGTTMQCLVCGENRPVLERLQSKVKGIPRRANRRHQHHFGKQRRLRVLRPTGVPGGSHLPRMCGRIHTGAQRPVVKRLDPLQNQQRGVPFLDPRRPRIRLLRHDVHTGSAASTSLS